MVDDYHRISRAVTGSVLVRRIVVHHDQALKSRKLSSLFWIERRFCIGEIALKTQGVFGGHTGLDHCALIFDFIAGAENDTPFVVSAVQQGTTAHLTLGPVGNSVIAGHHDRTDRQPRVRFVEHVVQHG